MTSVWSFLYCGSLVLVVTLYDTCACTESKLSGSWCDDGVKLQTTVGETDTHRDAVPMLHGIPNLYLEVRTACGGFLQDACSSLS